MMAYRNNKTNGTKMNTENYTTSDEGIEVDSNGIVTFSIEHVSGAHICLSMDTKTDTEIQIVNVGSQNWHDGAQETAIKETDYPVAFGKATVLQTYENDAVIGSEIELSELNLNLLNLALYRQYVK